MKIGLIGNMNNNNFSLMRYFRDLGADAHLLLYTNDGTGSLEHFKPESDTWNIEKWSPFIRQTQIRNGYLSALPIPYSWIVALRSNFKNKTLKQGKVEWPVTVGHVEKVLREFNALLGCGIAPAVCFRANITLDVFYPYAIGVEFLNAPSFVAKYKTSSMPERMILDKVKSQQEQGIRLVRNVVNAEAGLTSKALKNMGVSEKRLPIPMVYNREHLPSRVDNPVLSETLRRIKASGLSIMSHSRIFWKRPSSYSNSEWIADNKNTDWLLYGFRELLQKRPSLRPILILSEYGPDVTATKELCAALEIDSNVVWLPILKRKELMWLLQHVDLGAGEFYQLDKTLWGGTGWEVLSSGKPLLQGFRFSEGEFESLLGCSPPPMLPVTSPVEIYQHLLNVADNPCLSRDIGKEALDWFNSQNGVGLARRWLDILKSNRSDLSTAGV